MKFGNNLKAFSIQQIWSNQSPKEILNFAGILVILFDEISSGVFMIETCPVAFLL